MHSVVGFTIFGVDWEFIKPYLVLGFALGGVYALSGVSLVVLYRSTGVLNLAFGAIGTAGALIAWWLLEHTGSPTWLAYIAAIGFGGLLTLLYGRGLGPAFARATPRQDDGHARARSWCCSAHGMARPGRMPQPCASSRSRAPLHVFAGTQVNGSRCSRSCSPS